MRTICERYAHELQVLASKNNKSVRRLLLDIRSRFESALVLQKKFSWSFDPIDRCQEAVLLRTSLRIHLYTSDRYRCNFLISSLSAQSASMFRKECKRGFAEECQ